MKKNFKYAIDCYNNEDKKYDCICDVPPNQRIYDTDCKDHYNSIMYFFNTKKSQKKVIKKLKDYPHLLWREGEIEKKHE